jgi:hypothetical protein
MVFAALGAALLAGTGVAAAQTKATVYKSPYCGCCESYIARLGKAGIEVTVKNVEKLDIVKRMTGVPEQLESCHTMMIGGYVVEGHVPLAAVKRLLAERPKIRGIALPGMPQGSPGMGGEKAGPFTIYSLTESGPKVYMVQ